MDIAVKAYAKEVLAATRVDHSLYRLQCGLSAKAAWVQAALFSPDPGYSHSFLSLLAGDGSASKPR